MLTYALLEALDAKAAAPDHLSEPVSVFALAAHVERRVPQISKAAFGIEQLPRATMAGNNFPIGLRQPVLDVLGGPQDIPKESTHFLVRATAVREKPAVDAPVNRELPGWV